MISDNLTLQQTSKKHKSLSPEKIEALKFYAQAHRYLVKKYGTRQNHFSLKKVICIRHFCVGKGFTREQMLSLISSKMTLKRDYRRHPIIWYQRLYDFILTLTPEQWKEITQVTPYDKAYKDQVLQTATQNGGSFMGKASFKKCKDALG